MFLKYSLCSTLAKQSKIHQDGWNGVRDFYGPVDYIGTQTHSFTSGPWNFNWNVVQTSNAKLVQIYRRGNFVCYKRGSDAVVFGTLVWRESKVWSY